MSRTKAAPVRYGPDFQRVLEYAAYDCAQRGDTRISPDHLLFGLFREDFPLIDEVLAAFKVDSLVVLDRMLEEHPEGERPPVKPETVSLSPEALEVIAAAEREAGRAGHDLVTAAHTFLGLLHHQRDRLGRFFIREQVYRGKEKRVLSQVGELVRWLRFEGGAGESRELEVLDSRTVASYESLRLPALEQGTMRGFAVRLRLMKRFRVA